MCECEVCGYGGALRFTPSQQVEVEVRGMVAVGLSDAYIEAALWGKYSSRVSIREISDIIKKVRGE